MPSLVFTRKQALSGLSDEVARREQGSVPDFIYYFLRDVFYAVDADGDGYVTADAVRMALPSLASTKTTPTSSLVSPSFTSSANHTSDRGGGDTHTAPLSVMTPMVQQTWCSATSFITPDAAAHAWRPLDLCSFMQTFWPLVSDKMACLIGDTWSQQSSGSEHDTTRCETGNSSSRHRSPSASPYSPRRHHITFSPSPFRGLSTSPARASTTEAANCHIRSNRSSGGESHPLAPSSALSPVLLNTSIAWEQQRLYRETMDRLWPTAHHYTPLDGSCRRASSAAHPSPPLVPPPRRLFSDEEVEQLQVAFAYLDTSHSGFISSSEVAEALRCLLTHAAQQEREHHHHVTRHPSRNNDSDAEGSSSNLTDVADAMLRLAQQSSTLHATTGGSHVRCTPGARLNSISPASAGERCVSLPVFLRSFQCDSGAFPAELVAWCVRCSAITRRRPALPSLAKPSYKLAYSLQWMSPLECALVQQTLWRYVEQLCAHTSGGNTTTTTSEAKGLVEGGNKPPAPRSSKVPIRGLSQRPTANVCVVRKPVRRPTSRGSGRRAASSVEAPSSAFHSASDGAVQESQSGEEGNDAAENVAPLPLEVLETTLLNDVRNALFPNAFDFSVAAGTAAEAVLWSHVQAVCTLASRFAVVTTTPPPHSHVSDHKEQQHPIQSDRVPLTNQAEVGDVSATFVDVERLSELISADPRYLGLEVLMPLSGRLEAVVDAAQRLPRRCVVEAVYAVSDHLETHCTRGRADGARPDVDQLAYLLELRRHLSRISPPFARLITGATRFVNGTLALHDCLAVLSTQVLSVPPPLPPSLLQSVWRLSEDDVGASKHHHASAVQQTMKSTGMCARLLESAQIVKASRGWLRYACRRLSQQEQHAVVSALRHSKRAKLYETVRAMTRTTAASQVHEDYAAFLLHVCASCWGCRVDLVLAAHVALTLLASACVVSEKMLADESQWWEYVEAALRAWIGALWTSPGAKPNEPRFADTSAMAAICSTAAELGSQACRSISVRLCQLENEASDKRQGLLVVREAALTSAVAAVVEKESLWAGLASTLQLARDACDRLVHTIVGCCCPCHAQGEEGGLVDAAHLLRRWLEMCPLPLPVHYLSLPCPTDEVESIYYTLKCLAASEASQRSRAASVLRAADAFAMRDDGASAAAQHAVYHTASVVTGITPVCLAELLENDAVLAALYAISPPRVLGVWSGSLCHLETVLRPVLLSASGVRVSLRKLDGELAADALARKLRRHSTNQTRQPPSAALPTAEKLTTNSTALCSRPLRIALVAMAVPPLVQHAVAQLFHLVDGDGAGVVSEDQLRSYRPHVPAVARYGWHRFVTMLCCSSIATSPMSASGGLSASVLRSHCWRRSGGSGSIGGGGGGGDKEGQGAAASESSVATQRTDDVAATYTLGDVLARVGELRACVQAELLEERSVSADTLPVTAKACNSGDSNAWDAVGDSVSFTAGRTAVSTAPLAGTAQWWAAYLEVFCHCYSPLS
jgi:hypothetical protein